MQIDISIPQAEIIQVLTAHVANQMPNLSVKSINLVATRKNGGGIVAEVDADFGAIPAREQATGGAILDDKPTMAQASKVAVIQDDVTDAQELPADESAATPEDTSVADKKAEDEALAASLAAVEDADVDSTEPVEEEEASVEKPKRKLFGSKNPED